MEAIGHVLGYVVIVFSFLGIAGLVGALYHLFHIRNCTASTQGTVIDVDWDSYEVKRDRHKITAHKETRVLFQPMVEYDGHQAKSIYGSHGVEYEVGETVNIKYDPDDPETMYIEGEAAGAMTRALLRLGTGIIGVAVAVVLIIVLPV